MAKKTAKKEAVKQVKKPVKAKGLVAKMADKVAKMANQVAKAAKKSTTEVKSTSKKIEKAKNTPSAKKVEKAPLPKGANPKATEVKKTKGSSPIKESSTPVPQSVKTMSTRSTKDEKVLKKATKVDDGAPNLQMETAIENQSQDVVPNKKAKKYEGSTEEESKWLELQDKHRNVKAQPYKMSEIYLEKTPLEHKVLGWGFVLSVVNDRLEVLFRSGIKHLISNYKPKG